MGLLRVLILWQRYGNFKKRISSCVHPAIINSIVIIQCYLPWKLLEHDSQKTADKMSMTQSKRCQERLLDVGADERAICTNVVCKNVLFELQWTTYTHMLCATAVMVISTVIYYVYDSVLSQQNVSADWELVLLEFNALVVSMIFFYGWN